MGSVPGGKHHYGSIAVDEDQPREGRSICALQLDPGRRSGSFTQPCEQGLCAPGVPNAPPNLCENNLADELG